MFGAVHPNVQIDAKLDYMISRDLLKMDHTSLNIYKKLCDLGRDLKQTAFIHLKPKIPSRWFYYYRIATHFRYT